MVKTSIYISNSGQERQCLGITLYLSLDYPEYILCVTEVCCRVVMIENISSFDV